METKDYSTLPERFLSHKAVEGLSQSSLDTYRDILRGWQSRGEEYLSSLSQSKRQQAVLVVNQYLRWSGQEPLSYKVKPAPIPYREHLSQEQILAYAALPPFSYSEKENPIPSREGLMAKAFVLFLLDSGLRVSEALALNLTDVDWTTGKVTVYEGKGGKSRHTFVSKYTLSALGQYINKRKDGLDVLWIGRGQALTRQAAYALVKRELERIGVEDGHPHMLRHTNAINWIGKGGDLRTLQLLLGHSNINTTARYLQFTTGELGEAHHKFGPLGG